MNSQRKRTCFPGTGFSLQHIILQLHCQEWSTGLQIPQCLQSHCPRRDHSDFPRHLQRNDTPIVCFRSGGIRSLSGLSHYNKSLQAYCTMLRPDVSLQNKGLTCSHLTDTLFDL